MENEWDGKVNFTLLFMTQSFYGLPSMGFIMYLIIVSSKAAYVAERCCFLLIEILNIC